MTTPNLNVDLSQAQDIVCKSCGNYTFQNVFIMKKVSALLSPTGKEGVVPIPTFACNACGFINEEFLPVLPKQNSKIESDEGRVF